MKPFELYITRGTHALAKKHLVKSKAYAKQLVKALKDIADVETKPLTVTSAKRTIAKEGSPCKKGWSKYEWITGTGKGKKDSQVYTNEFGEALAEFSVEAATRMAIHN